MKRIYIRHADKEYANGDSDFYKHDPGITVFGAQQAKKISKYLIAKFGPPITILSSPYLRTRETAQIFNAMLDEPLEEILIDTSLSEYLGNHYQVEMDVRESTQVHQPPHPEKFDDMKLRVYQHHVRISEYSKTRNENEVMWIITHGLIIKSISDIIGVRMSKQLPNLTCLIVSDEKDEEKDLTREEIIMFKGVSRKKKKDSKAKYYHQPDPVKVDVSPSPYLDSVKKVGKRSSFQKYKIKRNSVNTHQNIYRGEYSDLE